MNATKVMIPGFGYIRLDAQGYDGSKFRDFEPMRLGGRHGWRVIGRNKEKYGIKPDGTGAYIADCAVPDLPLRHVPGWNGLVVRGFKRKRDAALVARTLNEIIKQLEGA